MTGSSVPVAVAAFTFVAEAVGIGLAFNVSPLRVLGMALDFYDLESVRPGWWVLAAGLSVVVTDLVRARFGPKPARAGTAARKPV